MSILPPETIAPDETTAAVEVSLEPVLSPRLALGVRHLVLTAALGAVFVMTNYVGLRPTDLWCHVAYGRWIIEQGGLPQVDPFQSFSAGMPVVDGAWLSQVLLAEVFNFGGGELLSTLFAGLAMLSCGLLARAVYLRTGNMMLSIAALVSVVVVGWSRLWTIRPEMFGTLSFCLLLWLLSETRGTRWNQQGGRWLLFSVLPLFALWANLHGSFLCGLAVLGCYLLGSFVSVAWRQWDLRGALFSRRVRRWLVVFELALLGSLLNPYGMELLVWTTAFARNANLADVLEWQSLSFAGVGGVGFALSLLALMLVLRHSRLPLRPVDVLLLGVFGIAAALRVRMLGWYAYVLVFVLAPHVQEIVSRWLESRKRHELLPEEIDDVPLPSGRNFRYTLACLLMVWICFAISPSSQSLLGGKMRASEQLYQQETPLGLSAYLREHPLEGEMFNPQYWGDWLLVDANRTAPVFVTTMIHNVPRRVWQDYMLISTAGPGWDRTLQRYRIDVVVVDRRNQPALAAVIRRSPNWALQYEDDQALLLTWKGAADRADSSSEPADDGQAES